VPNEEAIRQIAVLSPIVEVGAGLGYWASLIAKAGADIVAYDNAVNEHGQVKHYCNGEDYEPFYKVTQGDAEAVVELHSDRTVPVNL
jgi:protein-L-isoaspartate O-methyltransferase